MTAPEMFGSQNAVVVDYWRTEAEALKSELADAHEHIADQHRAIEALKAALRSNLKPEPEVITGVAWTGRTDDYFANMGAVNHEIALAVSQMARNAPRAPISHPDAIEVNERKPDGPQDT